MKIRGKSASHGTVVGRALVLQNEVLKIETHTVANIEAELEGFHSALERAKLSLEEVHRNALEKLGPDKAAIFVAHLMILQDPELVEATEDLIRTRSLNALAAYDEVSRNAAKVFEAMDNEYMRERAADVRDVADRVLREIAGLSVAKLSDIQDAVIVVCRDLAPSETAAMDPEKILGILTDLGGKTSHTAIVARTLEIPAVLGLKRATELIKTGDLIAFDGESGEVEINPDKEIFETYSQRQKSESVEKQELLSFVGRPNLLADGHRAEIVANIGSPEDLPGVIKYDAAGVGLYRTEFLFMDHTQAPSEEEQFLAYKRVLESLHPKPVTIRTLDVGGDKPLPYLKIPKEENPFLGFRAIRYCLAHPTFFKTQLRALLRASAFGNLRVMFPMIASLEELLEAKKHLEAARKELRTEGLSMADHVPVGVMIEIPSAAIASDTLAENCDFLSLGTNDLIQYTLAVDRLNEEVQHLYDPYHPAVLKLIRMVLQNAKKVGVKTSVCGEMGGSLHHIPLLLGWGLDELSMAPTSILRARRLLGLWSLSEAQDLAERIQHQRMSQDVESLLKNAFALKQKGSNKHMEKNS